VERKEVEVKEGEGGKIWEEWEWEWEWEWE
jgi:hypothetical protein